MYRNIYKSMYMCRSTLTSNSMIRHPHGFHRCFSTATTALSAQKSARATNAAILESLDSAVQSKELPNLFKAYPLNEVWFLVPAAYYNPQWLKPRLTDLLKQSFPNQELTPEFLLGQHHHIQSIIDTWIRSQDRYELVKLTKISRVEKLAKKNDQLYLKQLKDLDNASFLLQQQQQQDPLNPTSNPQSIKKAPKPRLSRAYDASSKFERPKGITYTHAWNYYFAMNNKKYDQPLKETRCILGAQWKSLMQSERKVWLDEYLALLQSGKDVHRGEVVDREIKVKHLERLAKYKHLRQLKSVQSQLESDSNTASVDSAVSHEVQAADVAQEIEDMASDLAKEAAAAKS